MVLEKLKSLTGSQQEAISKLRKYKVGALFMEQGTGKTRTAIELVNSTDCDFVLYIAPYRVINPDGEVESVVDEVERWGGFNVPVSYLGVESLSNSDRIYLEYRDELKRYKRPFIVVDESIKIKNLEANRTQRVLDLGRFSYYRLVLNGTPITRNLLDLYAQMYFLSPKILGMKLNQFKYTFCRIKTVTKRYGNKTKKNEFITGYENIDYLYSLISNYVYECQLRLNVKANHIKVTYNIEDKEEYSSLKSYYLNENMMIKMNNQIFMQMTQSMQRSYSLDEGKIAVMDDLVKRVNQEKTLIFCKYIDSREFCEKRYPKCLVLSYQKSSLGLNLQEYNTIIYFDKIWDYYLVEQSKSRIYRQGQEDDCTYYYLTGNIGLDKLIDKNIKKKVGMAEYFKKININNLNKEL